MKLNLNNLLIIGASTALILAIVFLVWWQKDIVIDGQNESLAGENTVKSSLTGLACENAQRRPLAVMLAGDLVTRPLSGIGQADMVFEMPVAPNGITRYMAVFQCESPKEIGSVRSARSEFIPLSAGIGAILTHWGGEHEALAKLDGGITDNVDAMKYEGTVFYRKKGIKPPHNGFTSFEKIIEKSKELKYNLNDGFSGYPHKKEGIKNKNLSNIVNEINLYKPPFDVKWVYDEKSNVYKRSRGGIPEIDNNSGLQVEASIVTVIETKSRIINELYIALDIPGKGEARVYQDGIVISGKWKKDPAKPDSKLYFYDNTGKEIEFAPGKMWIEIVAD